MKKVISAILAHATETQPDECCGLVVVRKGRKVFVPCVNVASDKATRFVISPEEYAVIEDQDEIVMVAHSHVYAPPEPSEADLAGVEHSGLPWLIVNFPNGTHTVTKPSGFKAPIIGREFCKGVHDCYALVRDYYSDELKIELPDYVRPENWIEDGNSILVDNFKAFGFKEIELGELQPNDCILMQAGASIPNHCAVYLGENIILHHVLNRLSSRDIYGSFWRKSSVKYLHYVGAPA